MDTFVYMLECQDGSIYTGITNNISNRMEQHSKGIGSKYVRSRGYKKLVYVERLESRSAAMRREREIKKLSPKFKWSMLNNNQNILPNINNA
jgi:putative endonuclease